MKVVLTFCVQVVIAGLIWVSSAYGHPGGLDSNGGHTDRATGLYHCHRSTCVADGVAEEGRASSDGYDRSEWPHWLDTNGDCMNTRHEVLFSAAVAGVVVSVDGCRILSGVWIGPYSGQRYDDPSDLDIDHVVPLAWAHAHGGAAWTRDQKAAFANDPRNLLAVDNGLNRSKGARGPDQWLPPSEAFVCSYLLHWVAVISAYPDLQFTEPQAKSVTARLAIC